MHIYNNYIQTLSNTIQHSPTITATCRFLLSWFQNAFLYWWLQTSVKSLDVCDVPVRAAKFVSRKNWMVTASVSMYMYTSMLLWKFWSIYHVYHVYSSYFLVNNHDNFFLCMLKKLHSCWFLSNISIGWYDNSCLQLQYPGKGSRIWSPLRFYTRHCCSPHTALHTELQW